jgi:holo-[acyl-carrier protein] synthase
MVVGLGIDVCSIERMQQALDRFGERFRDRILTPDERTDLQQRVDRATALAGRFAAKEAAAKALGAPRDVFWHDLQIRRGDLGAPRLELLGPAAAHGARLGVVRSLVSITHDGGVAAAVVVLEGQ